MEVLHHESCGGYVTMYTYVSIPDTNWTGPYAGTYGTSGHSRAITASRTSSSSHSGGLGGGSKSEVSTGSTHVATVSSIIYSEPWETWLTMTTNNYTGYRSTESGSFSSGATTSPSTSSATLTTTNQFLTSHSARVFADTFSSLFTSYSQENVGTNTTSTSGSSTSTSGSSSGSHSTGIYPITTATTTYDSFAEGTTTVDYLTFRAVTTSSDSGGHFISTSEVTQSMATTTNFTNFSVPSTNIVTAATYTGTGHANSPLRDTVFILDADRGGSGAHLGTVLWTFSASAGLDAMQRSVGRFTDFFGSVAGNSYTLNDYQVFLTRSYKMGTVTLDTATTSSGTGVTYTVTRYNSIIPSGATSNLYGPHTATIDAGSVGYGTLGFAFFTQTTFTHTDSTFSSVYSTLNGVPSLVSEIPTTTGRAWGATTSFTGNHQKWYSSRVTTLTMESRKTESTQVLGRSFSTVAVGTSTNVAFLGLTAYTVESAYPEWTTSTIPEWYFPASCWHETTLSSSSFSTTFENISSSWSSGTSLDEDHNLTGSWVDKMFPVTLSVGNTNPFYNYVRFSVLPRGHIAFGADIATVSNAYLTTSQGLDGGSTFNSSWSISLSTVDFSQGRNNYETTANGGVIYHPVGEDHLPTLTGVGMVGSSFSSGAEDATGSTALSILATWSTSTAGTGTATSMMTTNAATHTVAVVSVQTGDYLTQFPIEFNSTNRAIGTNEPFCYAGGWAAGDNNRNKPFSFRLGFGFASWTASQKTATGSTGYLTSSSSTSNSRGYVTFTVEGDRAVAFSVEQLVSANWMPSSSSNHYTTIAKHQLPTQIPVDFYGNPYFEYGEDPPALYPDNIPLGF